AHDELADAVGDGRAQQDGADHVFVVVQRRPDFFRDGREIVADDVKGGVGEKGRFEDPPTEKGIQALNLCIRKSGDGRGGLEPVEHYYEGRNPKSKTRSQNSDSAKQFGFRNLTVI